MFGNHVILVRIFKFLNFKVSVRIRVRIIRVIIINPKQNVQSKNHPNQTESIINSGCVIQIRMNRVRIIIRMKKTIRPLL